MNKITSIIVILAGIFFIAYSNSIIIKGIWIFNIITSLLLLYRSGESVLKKLLKSDNIKIIKNEGSIYYIENYINYFNHPVILCDVVYSTDLEYLHFSLRTENNNSNFFTRFFLGELYMFYSSPNDLNNEKEKMLKEYSEKIKNYIENTLVEEN
jgi:hypothetical protein